MKPAARLGDMHTCPMVTPGLPPIPHVGGPIMPPCYPPVIIGNMPAARIGDLTAHGGVIVQGWPTVLIGHFGGGPPGLPSMSMPSLAAGFPGAESLSDSGLEGRANSPVPGSTPAAKPASASNSDPAKDSLIEKSPTLTAQLSELKQDGWKIVYWDGPGSDCSKSGKTIRIDKFRKGDSRQRL